MEKKDRSKDDSKRDISVTLFTRNHLCKVDSGTIRSLVRQLMVAKEFLATGKVSHRPEDWDIKVSFDEFSDQSFESKIETLSSVLVNSGISPEMYVKKVYGNSLSEDDAKKEVEWISEQHKKQPEQDMGDNPFGEMGGDMPVPPEEDEGAE